MISALFAVAAVALVAISDLSYVRAIVRRQARPHRFTWFILLVTAAVTCASQIALGSRDGTLLFGWFVVVNYIIFVLSCTSGRGEGGFDGTNTISLVVAMVSVGEWFMMDSPLSALICILIADTIGMVLTAIKTHRDPHSEPLMMWGLGTIAAILNIIAVGAGEWTFYLAPVHLLVCDAAMATIIVAGRSPKKW